MLYYRFQEIAGALETVMNEGIYRVLPAPADFQLQITATAWDCLMRCWANGVFLHQLTHRYLWISLLSFLNSELGSFQCIHILHPFVTHSTFFHVMLISFTTAWHVLRLQMEDMASRYVG